MIIDRESIINSLIESDFYDAEKWNDYSYFEQIIRDGFIGYANMTDEELIAEYNERNEDGI